MEIRINTFKLKDSNNIIYLISEYQTQIPCGTLANPKASRPGRSRLVTSEGDVVIKISEQEFVLLHSNILLYLI